MDPDQLSYSGHLDRLLAHQVCGAMIPCVHMHRLSSRCAARWCAEDLQAISAGGGLSIPYREGEEAIDTAH